MTTPRTSTTPPGRARSKDDTVRWPDGTEATWEDVERGDYDWMSDDYEIIPAR